MVTPQTIEVASLGFENSLILMVLALVVFGPRRLPEIGRQIGRLMYEIRKASNDFKFQMEDELRKVEDAERQKKEAALALAAPAAVQAPESGTGVPASANEAPSVGVPVVDGQFPTPSPYPGEAVYPEVAPGDFHHTESYPQIQPPSTGEPIEAERPNRMAEAGEPPAEIRPNDSAAAMEHEPHG